MDEIFSAALCFLNFMPLWVIVCFRSVKSILTTPDCHGAEWCAIAGISVGTLFGCCRVIGDIKAKKAKGNGVNTCLKNIDERKSLTLEMLVMYVLPLWAFDFTGWVGLLEFLIFFLIIVGLAYSHMEMSGSLFLELLGYRYYECIASPIGPGLDPDKNGERRRMVVVKGTLNSAEGRVQKLTPMNDNLMLVLKEERK